MSADDNRLILDCLAGQTEAFGDLVARYQDRLYNSVYRLLDNAEDAHDVVQETFLHAYQSLRSFRGDSLFYTWLYRIAANTAVTLKRKQRGASRLEGGRREIFVEPVDPSESVQPGHALEMAEEERFVHETLQILSAEHRAVLILKDMEGLKYEEMAEILQVPIGTIRSRLHRARMELRDVMIGRQKKKDS